MQFYSHHFSDDTLPRLGELKSCPALRNVVIHPRSSDDISSAVANTEFLTSIRDPNVLPSLRLFVLAEDESDYGCYMGGTPVDPDEIIPREIFDQVADARPKLHLFVRTGEYKFDSHGYDNSSIVDSQAGEAPNVYRNPFLSYDLPRPDTIRQYAIPNRELDEPED